MVVVLCRGGEVMVVMQHNDILKKLHAQIHAMQRVKKKTLKENAAFNRTIYHCATAISIYPY